MKIAVIGAGYWGKNLVRNFSELGVLGMICDSDKKNLKALADKYPGVACVERYSGVLDRKDIDGIVIAAPATVHYELAKQALKSGKHVFVEKPLALDVAEAEEIVCLAKEKNLTLMVGHLLEYHPAVVKLKELIDTGALGKINYIYSNRLNLGKARNEENILWSFTPHDISVIRLLLGEDPYEVTSSGASYLRPQIADITISTLSFKSGVKAHIFVSWLNPFKEQKLVVIGDRKMAVFEDSAKDKLKVYDQGFDWKNRVPVPRKNGESVIAVDAAEPLRIECGHFIECIRERKVPRTNGKSGVKVLKILKFCQESMEKNGMPVTVSGKAAAGTVYYAHPTATIDQPCDIGEGTKIWHYSHIMKGARIGKNCVIGQNVNVLPRAVLGNNVKVQNNVSVYDRVTIEDDAFCGPSMVFTNVLNPRSFIPRKEEYKETLVKKGATIGANATIICGHTIGRYAFVGAGAVVTKDVPDYGLVFGNPARIKGWMCACGVKIEFKGNRARCLACKKEYIKEDGRVKEQQTNRRS